MISSLVSESKTVCYFGCGQALTLRLELEEPAQIDKYYMHSRFSKHMEKVRNLYNYLK